MQWLSLFDGMSCLQIAAKEFGFTPNVYYASEIDKHAINQTQLNFPDTIQLGSVTDWQTWNIDWSKIGLIGAGSPCQGFSFAGKQLAFNDPRSALFFTFIDILNHCRKFNPNVLFLLENVDMKREHMKVINDYTGVFPVNINSNLVSAQNRNRWYWSNIRIKKVGLFGEVHTDISQPEDKGILLKDILEKEVDEKYFLSDKMLNVFYNRKTEWQGQFRPTYGDKKSNCITSRVHKMGVDDNYIVSMVGRKTDENGVRKDNDKSIKTTQRLEPNLSGKTNCLTSVQKDNLVMQLNPSTESGGKQPYQQNRVYDVNGIFPALQTEYRGLIIPEATTKGFIEVNPGECFDFENPKSETRRGRKMDAKSNCLMAKETDFMQYTSTGRIRRLTPTECARLQTIPEWYKWECSDTQQYRMLGNGWTIDVIKHILRHITNFS
jgi:DNA-cytosine methyltransferase